MEKEKIIKKIKNACKRLNIKEPDFDSYKSVKKCCDEINTTCPNCFAKNTPHSVICSCEVKRFQDYGQEHYNNQWN